jgi:hypothetical protein
MNEILGAAYAIINFPQALHSSSSISNLAPQWGQRMISLSCAMVILSCLLLRYIPLLNIDCWFQQVKFQFFSSGSGLWVIYWRTSQCPPLAGPGCSKRLVPASIMASAETS